ncbi:MAG: glycosyltransferase family 2 protein [Deltaproteobacteria bacterium]|nr:glycosyltransferase family 2 protein [Deltaproteobacteria bacterium]
MTLETNHSRLVPAPHNAAYHPEKASVELSLIVPIHNESAGLDEFFRRVLPVLKNLDCSFEIICVDDGSSDGSLERLLALREWVPNLRVLSLSRNFGKDVALSAGLEHVSGAAAVPIDADLQDPPELIEQMVAKWREGFDVVYATRARRDGESILRQVSARYFYRIFDRITDIPIPPDTGDFRLLDRRVVDILVRLPERTRFMKGLFAWVGFKQTALSFDRPERNAGSTKWTYWRLWNFALDAITSFSSVPLKVWSYVGVGVSIFALLYALFLAGLTIVRGVVVPGYASIMVAVLFLGGVQLITLGIMGEYLARIYNEVKGRPLYLVRGCWGFDENRAEARAMDQRL